MMKGPKWGGLKPPATRKSGGKSPIIGKGTSSALGDFKLGRRSKSKKLGEVFG